MEDRQTPLSWDWLSHLPVWLGWIVMMNVGTENGFGYYSQTAMNILGPLVFNTILNALYVYTNAFFLLPRFYAFRPVLRYVYVLLLFPGIFLLLKTLAEKVYIYFFIPSLNSLTIGELMMENLYTLPFFVLVSFIYFLFRKNKKEKAWLTREKNQKELALLRTQLSPHFLFNTLNNLYSLGMQERHDEVNKGILKLSGILRYILHGSQSEQVPLAEELSYIHDLMEINKLMFPEDQLKNIQFRLVGEQHGLRIHPLILLTFVENAFKFGQGHPCEPHIEVLAETNESAFHFQVKNKICRQLPESVESSQGVGLKNTRRQLELLYPDKHELDIFEKDGYFLVNLQMSLQS